MIYGRGCSQHVVDAVTGERLRILDVGCGAGGTGTELVKRGHSVYGIDACEQAINEARSRLTGAEVADLDRLQALPFPEMQFDCIIFADIMEHLYQPQHILRLARECLKDEGYIIISIPNVANYIVRFNLLFGRFSSGESPIVGDPGHIRFFTLKTITELLTLTGYRIERLGCTAGVWLPLGGLHIAGIPVVQRLREAISRTWKTLFACQFLIVARKND